jgi:hydrogenase maturation protease
MQLRPALVIGYGNELRGDDGVGQAVVRALWSEHQELPDLADVCFVWSAQLVPEIAVDLSRAGYAVFVDAVHDGRPPGAVSVHLLEYADIAQPGLDRRAVAVGCWVDLSPAGLLLLSGELYGGVPPATLVTVSVGPPSMGIGLSPLVQAAVPVAAHAIRRAIASWRTHAEAQAVRSRLSYA